jgi:hypothetical protein
MLLAYDPISDLRYWPMPLQRFGQNPYGAQLYRIVFAPSRRELTFGDWGDGVKRANWTLKYPAAGNTWVMERWVPAEYYRCSKENWPEINGPYPDRGDYEICHAFEACLPDDANIEKLICWINASQEVSQYRTFIGLRNMEEQRRLATQKIAEDMIRSKLPAFGCRPMFAKGTIRGTKNDHGPKPRKVLTAQDIGMPTKPGMRATPTFQAPGTVNGVEQRI